MTTTCLYKKEWKNKKFVLFVKLISQIIKHIFYLTVSPSEFSYPFPHFVRVHAWQLLDENLFPTCNSWTVGETVGLVPVCHATRWDSGSLCRASFFSDRSRSCRRTYTWMKTPQRGRFTACTYTTVPPSWETGGGHMEGKGLASKGENLSSHKFSCYE